MQHIVWMGAVWRLSDSKYRKLTRDLQAGKDIDLDNYGKMVTDHLLAFADLQAAARGDDAQNSED